VEHRAQAGSRRRALLLASALLFAPVSGFPVRADAVEATRVAYVDMKRLLDNAPQVVAGRAALEKEFAPRDSALRADEQRLAELQARWSREAAPLDKDTADARKREIDALDRSIKRQRDAMRADLKLRSDQELDRSWRDINNAVVEFAREQGYDLVVPSPVVYASPGIDITDQVLERLKRNWRARAVEP
jgi:outer membrane protein